MKCKASYGSEGTRLTLYDVLNSLQVRTPRSSQQCVCGRFKLGETPDLLMTTDVVHVILKSMFICSAFMLIIVYIH